MQKIFHIKPQSILPAFFAPANQAQLIAGELRDQRQRKLTDLRISVIDRCNFRCDYCMPKKVFGKNHQFLPREQLLSFEEITRLARLFVAHGVEKIRLTGGEPLLRKNIEQLVAQLCTLRTPMGQPLEIAITSNGSVLAKKAQALKDAGLDRITVSVDSLDDRLFQQINAMDFPLSKVLQGIDQALKVGLTPIKINMVVKKGLNDHEIEAMAKHFRGSGIILRFIEFMDVGSTNLWQQQQVVTSASIIERLQRQWQLVPLPARNPAETAQRWGYCDSQGKHDPSLGEIGVISSISQAFCGSCSRARLSTEGKLFLCLFSNRSFDLRHYLRNGYSEQFISEAIASIWQGRDDNYSERRQQLALIPQQPPSPRPEMSYLGG